MGKFTDRIKHSWNAFFWRDSNPNPFAASPDVGAGYSRSPSRHRLRFANEKTIIAAIYARIAMDVASIPIRHVRLDSSKQYKDDMSSGLNDCLTVEANIDQGPRAFIQDVVQTLFDEGVVAIVPVDTTLNPLVTGGYDVLSMRAGKVMQWYPQHVMVRCYNDQRGIQEDVLLPKTMVAIVENPFYSVMNETNSTLQRLIRKLSLLDAVDDQSASGNLDLIIQLPYVIKTETRRIEAQKRLKEIEFQLKGSQYGIAYTDGTEKVVQLNRPAENQLMTRIQYLTTMLYGQLGITEDVMNGIAIEEALLNYYNRAIEPVLGAIREAMLRTFLTKTARAQGQSILYIRDPFKLVPVKDLAEIADKFTRNEILSSNDMRSIIGFRPSNDPKANKLLNKNLPVAYTELPQDGIALKKPVLPPKSQFPQVRAIPQGLGANSQNGTPA